MPKSRRNGFMVGLFSLGVLAITALTAGPAQADSVGPYYATPSWDQTLPAATRFIVLSNFNSQAVLDRETGLVWEKSPQTSTAGWDSSKLECVTKIIGNRKGWRLPSVVELASLIDPSVAYPGPKLPTGHPFLNVVSPDAASRFPFYWSATMETRSSFAWAVEFGDGIVYSPGRTELGHIWCVRGGMNVDQY